MATLSLPDTLVTQLETLADKRGKSVTALLEDCLETYSTVEPADDSTIYRTLLEQAHEGLWYVDLSGQIVYVNQRLQDLLGYTQQEMQGKHIMNFVAPEVQDDLLKYMEQRQEQGYIYIELPLTQKNGSQLLVHATASNVYGSDGQQIGAMSLMTDVVEQSKLETLLHANIYRSVVETIAEGIIVRTMDGRVIDCNSAAEKILDRTRDEILGKESFEPNYTAIREDGSEYPESEHPVQIVYDTFKSVENDIGGIKHKNGEVTWLSVSAKPLFLPHSDTPYAVVSTFQDVTEYKQETNAAQEQATYWQFMSDMAFEGLAITEDGIIKDANNRLAEIMGYEREELIEMPAMNIIAPEDHDFVISKMQTNESISYEHLAVRKDGTIILVEALGKPIEGDGKRVRAVAIRDVTKQRKVEHELEKTRALLQAAVEQSPAGIIIADVPDLDIQVVNQAAMNIRGYGNVSQSERAKYYDLDAWRTKYEDGTPYAIDELPLMRAAFGEQVNSEEMLNGNNRWVLVNAAPVRNSSDEIVAAIAVFSDITERKYAVEALRQSEERYRTLMESSPVAISVLRFDGEKNPYFVYVNDAAVKLYGGKSREELLKYPVMELTIPEQRGKLEERKIAYTQGSLGLDATEFTIRRLDGEIRNINVNSIAIEYEGKGAVMSVMTDITQQHQAELALRQSEQRYRSLLETAPIAISIVTDIDTRIGQPYIVYANTVYTSLFEADSSDELVGKKLIDLIEPIDHPQWYTRQETYQSQEKLGPSEYRIRTLKGNTRRIVVESTATEFEGESAYISVLTDVTEQRQAEEALRQSEDRYRRMLENAPVAIFVVDADKEARIRYINPAVASILAVDDPDTLLGISSYDLMPPETIKTFASRRDNVIEGNSTTAREYALKRMDGSDSLVYVRGSAIPINYDNKKSALIVASDVTERYHAENALRQSEERLRLALSSTGTGIWDWNIAENTVQWSAGIETIFGLEFGTFDGTFEAYINLIHEDDRLIVQQAISDALANKTSQYYVEHRILLDDGTIRWVSGKGVILRDDDGQPVRMMGLAENITERKQEQIALQEREARIERQNDALIQLATFKALGTGELETALEEITQVVSETVDSSRVSIWFYTDDDSTIECQMLYNPVTDTYEQGAQLDASHYPAYFAALRQNRVIVAHDAPNNPATREFSSGYLEENNILSMLDAPIHVSGKVYGVVCIEHVNTLRQWTIDDQHFAGAIADLVALAIEERDRQLAEDALRQSEETAREFQKKLRVIHDITLELSQIESLSEIYRRAVELGNSQLGFERLGLMLIDEENNLVRGTFGIDDNGELRDESYYTNSLTPDNESHRILYSNDRVKLWTDVELWENHEVVGHGWNAMAIIWDGSKAIGWLVADNLLRQQSARPYEADLLGVYGTALGSLITQRQSQEQLEGLVGQLTLLAEIDRLILRSDSPKTIAETIVHPLKALLKCNYVIIVRNDVSQDMIYPLADTDKTDFPEQFKYGETAKNMLPRLFNNEVVQAPITDDLEGGLLVQYLQKSQMKWFIVVPLLHSDELIGSMVIGQVEEKPLSEEQVQIAQQVVGQLSVAIRQSLLYQEVQGYAESLKVKVQERTQQLEDKANEMEAFTYSVSHDLRAPLRAINGFSDLMLEAHQDELSEKAQHYLNRIHSNSRQMGLLIDDLLMLSRIGRKDLRIRQIKMQTFVKNILAEMTADNQVGQASIKVDDLQDCHADEALLKQVMINLISNAVKYSQKQDNPHVHIGCTIDDEENVVYYIRDNGVGFDMNYADKLFGVFQRLHDSHDYEGTGIGLATVRRIITRHGGKVWADAELDKGATFYFTLPEYHEGDTD